MKKMKVFISWSGEKSKAVAELLHEWLPCVLQAVEPWISSSGIDRGTIWFQELNNQLAETRIGLICLTSDNLNKPWILFEAGALAKGLSSNKVCPILIEIEPKNLVDPLAQFNATIPDQKGIRTLLETINQTLEPKPLDKQILDRSFEAHWPNFESSYKSIIEREPKGESPPERKDGEILAEILSIVRAMQRGVFNSATINDWMNRYYGSTINSPEYNSELDSQILEQSEFYRKSGHPINYIFRKVSSNLGVDYSYVRKVILSNPIDPDEYTFVN